MADPQARAEAAAVLLAGEIVVIPFNGIFVLVGDADDPAVPAKIASAKQRPQAKGVALVCPPEHLHEHVIGAGEDLAPVERLYAALHALGVILPAGAGAPPHAVQAATILNVWTEQRPTSPLRELVDDLRRRGGRALAGTSANESGRPTITDASEVAEVFASRVPLILLDDFAALPPERRRSASIVDLTGPRPRLVREGSVPADDLRAELRRLGLGELAIAPDVRRV